MDDAQLRSLDEGDDMLDLRTHRNLVANHEQRIEQAGVALVNNTVSMADMLDDFFVEPFVLQNIGIDAVEGCRFLGSNDIRRDIATETATGLNHRPRTDAAPLAHQDIAAEDDEVFQEAIPGNLAAIAEDAAVGNHRIVGNMHPFVEEVPVSNLGLALRRSGTVHDDIFTEDVVVADKQQRIPTFIFEILRFGTQDSMLENTVVCTHASSAQHAGVGHNLAIITYLYIFIDVGKRVNGNILPQLGACIYIS